MKLGIIADTHNYLDPGLAETFTGVDHIIHAGDVCHPGIITRLESIAPVTVVRGNNDSHPGWQETEVREWCGVRILIEHIVVPQRPGGPFRDRLLRFRPAVVIFGHTHRPFCEIIDEILYLNPGSAGPTRFGLLRSVCLLHLGPQSKEPGGPGGGVESSSSPRIQPCFCTLRSTHLS
jgi:putative phosphoesterase